MTAIPKTQLADHTSGVRLRLDQLEAVERLINIDPEIDLSTAVRRGLDMFLATHVDILTGDAATPAEASPRKKDRMNREAASIDGERPPKVGDAISLEEFRLMRERLDLQLLQQLAQRTTGQGDAALDELLEQNNQELDRIDSERRWSYEQGLKTITGDVRPDRARHAFESFLVATCPKRGTKMRMEYYRTNGFTVKEVGKFMRAFRPWWKQQRGERSHNTALAK